MKSIKNIRREYNASALSIEQMPDDPFQVFHQWYQEHLAKSEQLNNDPTAFVLSTVDNSGMPDSRIVLLKAIKGIGVTNNESQTGCYEEPHNSGFIFFTNYLSNKGQQIAQQPFVSMNFYWPEEFKQIKVRGSIKKISREESQAYFATRPYASQVAAIVSEQSQAINPKELDSLYQEKLTELKNKIVLCPEHWGGYIVLPQSFEFWHGREGRLHHRVQYQVVNTQWQKQALAP